MVWLSKWNHRWWLRLNVCKWTISLYLEVVSSIIVNIIQIERTTNIANFGVEIIVNHIVAFEAILDKELEVTLEVTLEDKVYLKTYYHHRPCIS